MNLKIIGLSLATSIVLVGCSSMLPYKDDFSCDKGKGNGVCGSVTEIYDLSSDMDKLREQANPEYAENKAKANEKNDKNDLIIKELFKAQKLQEMVEAVEIRKIQNETPTIFRYFLTQSEIDRINGEYNTIKINDKNKKASIKSKKKTAKKPSNSKTNKKSFARQKNKTAPKNDTAKLFENVNTDNNTSNAENTLAQNGIYHGDMNATIQDINSTNLDANNSKNLVAMPSAADCAVWNGDKITHINGPVTICVYNANIREQPSCKANVLWVAKKGEKLEALYEQGGWIKLKDGTYVHKSIVTQD